MSESAAISREHIKRLADSAAIAVSRAQSDVLNGYADEDTVTYYEGRRDALKALLEPEEVEADA